MGCGHVLFVDNFNLYITKAGMVHDASPNKIGWNCVTTQKRISTRLVNVNLDKGTAASHKVPDKDILAVKYRAAKENAAGKPIAVLLLSTGHEDRMANTNKRDVNGNVIQKCRCIKDYNRCMGSVDTMDQQIH